MFPKQLKTCLLGCFLLGSCLSAGGQTNLKISGKIHDAKTKEPLAFATVSFVGNEAVGTTTDLDGTYELESKWGTDSLEASFVGYAPLVKRIDKKDKSLVVNFELEEEASELKTVEISAKKQRYRRKDNPAVALIKNVIDHKDRNHIQGQDFFEYDRYEKIEIALNNITDKFKERRPLKKLQFIFNYMDTSEINGKPYLPVYIREIASKVYFRKSPKQQKEYRYGIKISGLEKWIDNASLTAVNDALYQQVDIYENEILLFGNPFPSPLSSVSANLLYRFYILDTIQYKGMEVIDLAFMPAQKQDLGFKGNLYILNDSSYAVVKADFGLASQINLNWVNDFELVQEFEKKDSAWVLSQDRIVADMAISGKSMGLFASRTVSYRDYLFNVEREASTYQGVVNVVEAEDVYKKDAAFWAQARHVPLTAKEQGVYHLVDTLQRVPVFRTTMNVLKTMLSGYINTEFFDIGSVGTFYSFNNIEGFRLRFGGITTPKLFPKVALEGYAAYGFKDRQWKYAGAVTYSFKDNFRANPKHFLRLSYQHERNFVGQKFDFVTEETFFLSFKRGSSDKMLLLDSWELNYFYELPSDLYFDFKAKNQKQRPLGALKFNYFDPENPGVVSTLDSLKFTEFSAHVRWSPNEKYTQGQNFRHPIFGKNPIFNLTYSVGIKGVLGGGYNYQGLTFDVFKRLYVAPFGYTDVIFEGGKTWGKNIPYYMLLLPKGNQTYAYMHRSYNMMNYLEFVNDAFVGWNIEHNFNGFFFNKIPLFKKLKLREVATFKGIWGSLSDANNPNLDPSLIQFIKTLDGQAQTFTLQSKPYMEASIGVANIFKVIRFDLLKRLNYLDHPDVPQLFGVKGLGLRVKTSIEF